MTTKDETPRPETLGPFELSVMTAVLLLGGESYGVPIYDKVSELAGRRTNQGSLYLTLDRLEEKGFLVSRKSDPAKEPRGNSKRFFRVTERGALAMQESSENNRRLLELYDENAGSLRKWLQKLKPSKLAPQGSSRK